MLLTLILICFASSAPAEDAASLPALPKTGTVAASLLLPLFAVDTQNTNGLTTFWAIRNEASAPIDVSIRYYETDRPQSPQFEENVTLGPKAIRTVDVRSVDDLRAELDGFARGYIIFETTGGTIHGDYFLLNSGENFASGSRLVKHRSRQQCQRSV